MASRHAVGDLRRRRYRSHQILLSLDHPARPGRRFRRPGAVHLSIHPRLLAARAAGPLRRCRARSLTQPHAEACPASHGLTHAMNHSIIQRSIAMESDVVSDTHADVQSLTDAGATLPIAEVINGDVRSSRVRDALDDRRPRATRRQGHRRSGCANTRTQACHAISDGGLAQRSCRSSSGSVPMRDRPCRPISHMC